MLRRKLAAACALAATALLVTACGGQADSASGGGAAPVKLSFEWTCEGNWAIAFVGEQKGMFSAENLAVSYVRGQGGSATVPLVGTGEQDLAILSAPPVMLGAGQGLPITVVGVAATGSPVNIYADPSIKTPKDLEGKTLAVQTDQFEGAVWNAFVAKTGIDASKVHVIQSTDASTTEFVAKRIDAIVAFSATPSSLALTQREGGVTVLPTQDYVPTYGHTLVANNKYLSSHGDTVRAFERAWAKATAYAVAHPDEALSLLESKCGDLSPESAKYTLDQYLAAYSSPQSKQNGYLSFTEDGLNATKSVLVNAKLMDDVDLSDYVSLDYLPNPPITS